MLIPTYKRPRYLCNPHLETIWPSLFRRVEQPSYRRERITTTDDDFLDLDWLQSGHKHLTIISHGLEGDSRRNYVVGMANALSANGFDVLAWNFRGCSGEINRQPRFTHNGATDDLDAVVRHALIKYGYETISLVGFSMGGNLSLMYLGRDTTRVPGEVKTAVCFSVPCDLAAASSRLAEAGNVLYMTHNTIGMSAAAIVTLAPSVCLSGSLTPAMILSFLLPVIPIPRNLAIRM